MIDHVVHESFKTDKIKFLNWLATKQLSIISHKICPMQMQFDSIYF